MPQSERTRRFGLGNDSPLPLALMRVIAVDSVEGKRAGVVTAGSIVRMDINGAYKVRDMSASAEKYAESVIDA